MLRPTQDWNESTLRTVGYSLVGLGIVSTLLHAGLLISAGSVGEALQQLLLAISFLGVLIWLFRAVPRNRAVWALAWAAVLGGGSATLETVVLVRTGMPVDAFTGGEVALSPTDLDLVSALSVGTAAWMWTGIFLLSVHFVLLFPSGHASSRFWRVLVRVATWAILGGSLATAVALAPWVQTPYDQIGNRASSAGIVAFLLLFASIASIINLILRVRRSEGEERLQYRWITWALGINVVLLLGFGWLSNYPNLHGWISTISLAAIPISIGVAMTKRRLYDIDVVISRTFVYTSLAVFITAVYVGIVVGVGLLFGTQDEPSVWLGIVATVVIAIAFQPLRRRLQKVANRIVYGRRATPYEVLSSFSQGVAAVDPDVLEQVAESLTEGTTATGAVIWVQREQMLHRIASWPQEADLALEVSVGSAIPGADRMAEITHDGERLGMISLTLPAGQPFPPTDEQLLEQVTAGLGLALRNLLLTDDLRRRVDQLRESRRRIVAVQDQTRQGLERDLHDGAQQRLVALKIKVSISASMSEKEGLDDVKQILDNVKDETDLTIDSLRTLARGIYPPLLDAEGLGPALTTQLHRMAFPITVQAAGIGRHPRELEATVYFCVLEAVQNSMKHAQANSVLVTLSDEEGFLTFEVRDDGIGFDIDHQTGGNGLINITDRLDAVEGSLEIDSRPGHGTLIKGRIPVFEGALA